MQLVMEWPLIIAHGANDIDSCLAYLREGAEIIEFDVRRTKNGEFVLSHDKVVSGSAGLTKLEDVLKVLKNKVKIDVELKEEGYEKEVIDLILKYFKKKDIIISSGNVSSLKIIKENYLGIKTGLILFKRNIINLFRTFFGLFPRRAYGESKSDYIIIPHDYLSSRFLKKSRKNGASVLVWTLNDKRKLIKYIKDDRVSGVITDNVKLARECK